MMTYKFDRCNWDNNKCDEGVNIIGIDDGGVRRLDVRFCTENGHDDLSPLERQQVIEAFWSKASDLDITALCASLDAEFGVEGLREVLLESIEQDAIAASGTLGRDWLGIIDIDGDRVAVEATNGYTTWQHLTDLDAPQLEQAMALIAAEAV